MFLAEITFWDDYSKVRRLPICADTLFLAEYFVKVHIEHSLSCTNINIVYMYDEQYAILIGSTPIGFVHIIDHVLSRFNHVRIVRIPER